MDTEVIKAERGRLESQIGALLRDFESRTGVKVTEVLFGPITVARAGDSLSHEFVQSRSSYEVWLRTEI